MAKQILDGIPVRYTTVFLVCDTYTKNSIKAGERIKRGVSERYILASPDMKVPYDFNSFLRNGENKEMLFDLLQLAIRWPTTVTSKAKVSRQTQNARVKSKSLASKAKRSPQKQNARRKSKTLAAKAKRSPQK